MDYLHKGLALTKNMEEKARVMQEEGAVKAQAPDC